LATAVRTAALETDRTAEEALLTRFVVPRARIVERVRFPLASRNPTMRALWVSCDAMTVKSVCAFALEEGRVDVRFNDLDQRGIRAAF
jgi:hypothetical protein